MSICIRHLRQLLCRDGVAAGDMYKIEEPHVCSLCQAEEEDRSRNAAEYRRRKEANHVVVA